jgi:hypothetical protein
LVAARVPVAAKAGDWTPVSADIANRIRKMVRFQCLESPIPDRTNEISW